MVIEKKTSPGRRRHKLVIHYADGRVVKGNTYKLNPDAKGFYLIPVGPSSGGKEIFINFTELKSVFYVKDFEGGHNIEKSLEEYVPEGHEVTVRFKDGEVIHGFAFDYTEDSPRFIVDVRESRDNNYAILVERAYTEEVNLGRVFRAKKLRCLVDSAVKMLLLKYYYHHPGAVETVDCLAEKIERTVMIVRRDIKSFIEEGLMEWVGPSEDEKVKFLPVPDEETTEFIKDKLKIMK